MDRLNWDKTHHWWCSDTKMSLCVLADSGTAVLMWGFHWSHLFHYTVVLSRLKICVGNWGPCHRNFLSEVIGSDLRDFPNLVQERQTLTQVPSIQDITSSLMITGEQPTWLFFASFYQNKLRNTLKISPQKQQPFRNCLNETAAWVLLLEIFSAAEEPRLSWSASLKPVVSLGLLWDRDLLQPNG